MHWIDQYWNLIMQVTTSERRYLLTIIWQEVIFIVKLLGIELIGIETWYRSIKHGVSKIIPEGHWEGNKSPAVLRGTVARWHIAHIYTDVRPGHHVSTCTGTYSPGRASSSGCIKLHLILYSIQRTATDRRWPISHSNTPIVRNRAPLTTRSNSLRYQQPSTILQNSTPKRAGQNHGSISQEVIYHGRFARTFSRYQVFEKLL